MSINMYDKELILGIHNNKENVYRGIEIGYELTVPVPRPVPSFPNQIVGVGKTGRIRRSIPQGKL